MKSDKKNCDGDRVGWAKRFLRSPTPPLIVGLRKKRLAQPTRSPSLSYLLLLTGFLFLLELSFFIQCNRVYLSDYTFVSKNLSIPATIIPGILYFICAQIGVHLLYCFALWMIIELTYTYFYPLIKDKINFVIMIWALSVVTILVANQYYFPNSKFAELTSLIFFNDVVTKYTWYLLSGTCCIFFLLGLMQCVGWAERLLRSPTLASRLLGFAKGAQPNLHRYIVVVSIIVTGFFIFKSPTPSTSPATASRPNIILIGIDSLRPDFLSYFGGDRVTPFLDSMLEQSSVFAEAVTPLARTFPSWSSLLTGLYPHETHIRSNLAAQQQLDFSTSLPAILQQNGYETIYATDETRFSNIDKNLGFDRIISPPMGLNDFLIGNFNDFPLSNLIINTAMGKILFPHSYANRPVHFTYDPDSFIQSLRPMLEEAHSQPLFLATHFCLTHAPYLWADLSGKNLTAQERYAASIVRVDQQIRDYFTLLKQYHLLDHAIVVLLSDHGETLEFSGDRITEKDLYLSSSTQIKVPKFYPSGLDHEEVNQSAGHGTDVMGLPQYHTLLAFKFYGVGEYQTKDIPGVVSLLDIKPTLLEFLKIPAPNSSGISLLAAINEKPIHERHIFIESDYSPSAIRTVYPEVRKVMLEGIDIFQINPVTTRLTVKNEMTAKIISSKQYADIYGEWMLALYPQDKNYRMPILINLNTGLWTNDMQSNFAQNSPAGLMLEELKKFYKNEITNVMTSLNS